MARPPRIPVLLPWGDDVVYFLTFCVYPRRPVLANDRAWGAVLSTLARLDRWRVVCVVLMPDHLHLITAPVERDQSLSAFCRWFKRWFNESHQPDWQWQQGVFDRLLRHDESAHEKWIYIRENPVRAGLVKEWHEWPYSIGFKNNSVV
jgi:REP element-mobilizing transposase RayT